MFKSQQQQQQQYKITNEMPKKKKTLKRANIIWQMSPFKELNFSKTTTTAEN